jgi:hypothetical protein
MSNSNRTQGKLYTAYIVRDENSRRFLNRRTYSGRVRGIWNTIDSSEVFYTREQAQSCASNINARRPEGFSSYFAQVREIQLRGRGKRLDT